MQLSNFRYFTNLVIIKNLKTIQKKMNEQEEKAIREHDKQEENTRLYYLTQVPFVSSYGGLIGDCMFYGHGETF